jgi:hypothetical protein
VTDVDLVEKAFHRARVRVRTAGVEMKLSRADVTALRRAGIGDSFRFILDTSTFHGLPRRSKPPFALGKLPSRHISVFRSCWR